jgi:hypothetical protein
MLANFTRSSSAASTDSKTSLCATFSVFGPRQDPASQYSGMLSRFMLAIVEGKSPVIYGDGEQTRDFTYVANVAYTQGILVSILQTCHQQLRSASAMLQKLICATQPKPLDLTVSTALNNYL